MKKSRSIDPPQRLGSLITALACLVGLIIVLGTLITVSPPDGAISVAMEVGGLLLAIAGVLWLINAVLERRRSIYFARRFALDSIAQSHVAQDKKAVQEAWRRADEWATYLEESGALREAEVIRRELRASSTARQLDRADQDD